MRYLKIVVLWGVLALIGWAKPQVQDPFFNDPFGEDLFKEMLRFQQEMDSMFENMQKQLAQRLKQDSQTNALQTSAVSARFEDKGDFYELAVPIPQYAQSNIAINAQNGYLYLSAKVVEQNEKKTPNGSQTHAVVKMYRSTYTIPADADISTLDSDFKEGKLIITLRKKKQKAKP